MKLASVLLATQENALAHKRQASLSVGIGKK